MIAALISQVAIWCAAIVGVLLLILLIMALRNRMLFGLAMRNVLLSKKKSSLIIFGLVLSTILTTASLGLGDSLGASMQSQTQAQTGQRDERLTKLSHNDNQVWQYFTPTEAQQLISQVQTNPEVATVIAAVNTQGDVDPGTVNTQGFVPAYDQDSKIISAENQLLAVPTNFDSVWGPLYSDAGQQLRFADLQPGEIYLGNDLAHFLGAQAGHHLTLFLGNVRVQVTVKAVLNTEVDPAEKYTLVMPLAYFQQVEKVPGAVNVLYIKNKDQNQPGKDPILMQQLRQQFGNVPAAQQLKDFLNQLPQFKSRAQSDFNTNVPPIDPSRQPISAFLSSVSKPQMSTTFVNSIQDRSVQSMLKRVVTKIDNSKLPQLYQLEAQVSQYRIEDFKQDAIFLSQLEGAGTSLGLLLVSILLIAAAMLLIYLIFVMLMAERKVELGISRALGLQRSHLVQLQLFEGAIYTLISALIGLPLGIAVTGLLVVLVDHLPTPFWGAPFAIDMHIGLSSLIIAFSLGFLVTFIVVALSAYRISRLNIVSAIRDQEAPTPQHLTLGQVASKIKTRNAQYAYSFREEKSFGGLVVLLLTPFVAVWQFLGALLRRGILLLPFGLLVTFLGVKNKDLFIYSVGISLCIISLGLLVRWLLPRTGVSRATAERLGFTFLGVALILYWALPLGTLESLVGLYGPLDMVHFRHGYLLKGTISSVSLMSVILVVVGSIWFVLYNGDWLLKGLLFLVRPFSRLTSALRLSVLYALKNRLRTGLNIAMFALVSFIVVLAITMGVEITHDSGVTHQSGNWQILTDTEGLPHNLDQQVMANPHLSQMIERAGSADNEMLTYHIPNARGFSTATGFLRALSDDFLADPQLHIYPRGAGYTSDSQVWNAVKTQPGVAVMYFDSSIEWGVNPNAATFTPFTIQVLDSKGALHPLKVIGFIPSGSAWPLAFVSAQTGGAVYGAPAEPNWFVFRVKPGVDENQVRTALTETFGQKYGMQPESSNEAATKLSDFLTGIFNLLGGYLALGLVIGLCGLAVISRRVVIERFQQIGILRAIGCEGGQILRIFLLESSFIAFLGLFIGAALALWWAYQFTMIAFPPLSPSDNVFQVPVLQIVSILVVFYLIVLVATYLPARTASRITPAAALRHE